MAKANRIKVINRFIWVNNKVQINTFKRVKIGKFQEKTLSFICQALWIKIRSLYRLPNRIHKIPPGIEGLKTLGVPGDLAPAILDESLIHYRVPVRLAPRLVLSWAAGF